MTLSEILQRIDTLQSQIIAHGKLTEEVLKKIQYKFRLDWNYHSNAMEGNSLTREETRSVMINNITVEGKPLKDVIEIRGHDTIITNILKIGKGELRLSEKRIKEIHKGIMHEDDPEHQSKIGEWKKKENHIYNYKGEKYEFVAPADVQESMHQLINWLNTKCEEIGSAKNNRMHPALVAFEFHLRYVTIHPFYDGNGRTSRILMNLILIMFGYPPVIITVNEKETYNRYLADIQGYGGSPDLFYEFMGKLLIHSQELILKAIEGEDIDEPDDLDKKLRLLDRELSSIDPDQEVIKKFSPELFFSILDEWVIDMFRTLLPTVQKFNKFFNWPSHYLFFQYNRLKFSDENPESLVNDFRVFCKDFENQLTVKGIEIGIAMDYKSFVKGGLNTFDYKCSIRIKFENLKYSVTLHEYKEPGGFSQKTIIDSRLLHLLVTEQEITTINKVLGESIYSYIDYQTKKLGIR